MPIGLRHLRVSPGALVAGIGVPLSAAGMAAAFRGPDRMHWRRLALAHGSLGLVALVADRSVRRCVVTPRDVSVALRVGLGLFAASSAGDLLMRKSMRRLNDDANTLNTVSSMISPVRMCTYLALVIAPGEELFWRGLLQDRFARRYGARDAAVLTNVLYGAAHVATGNFAVTGVAMCMGSVLSFMRANGASVERLALTHAFWVVPTLLRERARSTRGLRAEQQARTATIHNLGTSGEADMALFRGSTSAGREVSRWSRLVQLVNNSVHVALYEGTRGRLGTRMLGNQVGILTTIRRSGGEPYSVPLFTFRDGDDVIVVASYRGSVEHPAWFRNLLANPNAVIRIGSRAWPVQAKVMDADERAVWWERIVRRFKGYAEYQRRTTREIPMVRLTPRPDAK
jgi:F420H(2)-dependent quinone reductase